MQMLGSVSGLRRIAALSAAIVSLMAVGGTFAHDERIDALRRLLKEKQYAEAETAARRLLAEFEAGGRADSLETAEVLDAAAIALDKNGRLGSPDTRLFAERALAIRERLLGGDDLLLAASIARLAKVLAYVAEYREAASLFERTIGIAEKHGGPESPDLARLLVNLAITYKDMGQFPKARQLCERALAIQEKSLGPDHTDVAGTLTTLGNILKQIGTHEETRAVYQRALAIREKAFGPDRPDVAVALTNLANVLRQAGEFDEAEAMYERALSIETRAFGPDSPNVAPTLNSLANLYLETGDDSRSRPLYERVLALVEKEFGPDHPRTAMALRNLANQLGALGDLDKALELHRRALAIREKSDGAEHPEVATTLNNIAEILRAKGEFAGAKPLYERSLAIREKTLRQGHPDIARSLKGLGNLMRDLGEDAHAKEFYQRALEIREKSLGPENTYTAASLVDLADQLLLMNERGAAGPVYERAEAIRRNVVPMSVDLAVTLNHLARFRWSTGEVEKAFSLALEAESIARAEFQTAALGLSEREALLFEEAHVSGLDLALSILASQARLPGSARNVEIAWDNIIRSRAMVLDEMANRFQVRLADGKGVFDADVAAVDRASNHLARLVVKGPDDNQAEAYTKQLRQARDQLEAAERSFAAKSADFRNRIARRRIGLAEVRTALPGASALIGFAQYSRISRNPTDQPVLSYLAFVLKSGSAAPTAVPLGTAAEIHALVEEWRREVAAAPQGLSLTDGPAEVRYREAGARLRRAIWDPFEKEIRGRHLVFIVPDAALHLVSIATLPAEDGHYLVEKSPLLHYVSTERDLVADLAPSRSGTGLMVVGGADFDAQPRTQVAESVAAKPSDGVVGQKARRGGEMSCQDLREMKLAPLPGSLAEVDEVESLWLQAATRRDGDHGGVLKLTGASANEAAIKMSSPGHRVLHFATHGFFARPDRCVSMVENARARTRRGLGAGVARPEPNTSRPLELSGLALAGANLRQQADADQEDGILTAEEIGTLNLTEVEWAVLSACDTGLGKVITGEGVLGLRRAFEVAGVGTLIMSLWSMEDEPTRRWMKSLYDNRLRGQSTAEAMHHASREIIAERRSLGRSTHPFYWGCFVAAGGWK